MSKSEMSPREFDAQFADRLACDSLLAASDRGTVHEIFVRAKKKSPDKDEETRLGFLVTATRQSLEGNPLVLRAYDRIGESIDQDFFQKVKRHDRSVIRKIEREIRGQKASPAR